MPFRISLKNYARTLALLTKVIDVFLYLLSGLIVYYFSFSTFYFPAYYLISYVVAALLIVPVFSSFGVYESLRGRSFIAVYFHTLYPACVGLMITLAAIAFLTKTGELYSRSWFLYWHFWAIIFLTLFRAGLRQGLMYLRRRGHNHKKIIIIGQSKIAEEIIRRTKTDLWIGFDVEPIIDRPNLADFEHYVQQHAIDEIWLMLSKLTQEQVRNIVASLQQTVVTIRYFPDIIGSDIFNHSFDEILGFPVINVIASPMSGINRLIKALEDRILTALILVLVSPLLLIIAIFIKLTSTGPIFYRQMRHGWDGKPIEIYKFRTMIVHQESRGVVSQATPDDPRITKVGKLLRKTSLDELPQFINVLQGRMSIVGPRPHAIEHNEQYKKLIPAYMQRHQVKPGITGWAQINGWRGETDTLEKMQNRINFDLYYINHWSLWFDLKIIFLTIFRGFVHKNAY